LVVAVLADELVAELPFRSAVMASRSFTSSAPKSVLLLVLAALAVAVLAVAVGVVLAVAEVAAAKLPLRSAVSASRSFSSSAPRLALLLVLAALVAAVLAVAVGVVLAVADVVLLPVEDVPPVRSETKVSRSFARLEATVSPPPADCPLGGGPGGGPPGPATWDVSPVLPEVAAVVLPPP
jgi:hypothetical protein